jgi:serine protease Do
MIKRSSVVLLLLFLVAWSVFAQPVGYLQLEKMINQSIQKVYPACVRMYGFDTVRNVQNSAQFSGVVVSPDGSILTVAHAVFPGRIYKVTFPDGKQTVAMALGRIVTETSTSRPDVAMMKIRPGPGPSLKWDGPPL